MKKQICIHCNEEFLLHRLPVYAKGISYGPTHEDYVVCPDCRPTPRGPQDAYQYMCGTQLGFKLVAAENMLNME
jgi:hypothetical protein